MRSVKPGFTLIEMLVVLSVGGLLTGLAIQILERALATGTNTTRQLDEARNLNRFADQFRSDVHLAIDVVVDSPTKVVARLENGAVTYAYSDGAVQRAETAQGAGIRNELYVLGDTRSISIVPQGNPNRLQLTVQSNTGLKQSPTRTDRVVVAETGRRLRLTKPQGESP